MSSSPLTSVVGAVVCLTLLAATVGDGKGQRNLWNDRDETMEWAKHQLNPTEGKRRNRDKFGSPYGPPRKRRHRH